MEYSEAKKTITAKLDQLASNGVFGEGRAVSIEFTESNSKGPQFMSSIFFASVQLSEGGEAHVVVKIQMDDELMRKEMDYDGMFHNEKHAYMDLLPLIRQESINVFPKCFYGEATRGKSFKEDIIILEDIHKKGFDLTTEILSLDLDHLRLAVHKLGQFHGLSYKYKQSNRGYAIKNELKFLRNKNSKARLVKGMFRHTLEKVIESSKNGGINNDALQKVLRLTNTVEDWLQFFSTPEEPFAVICHGDFNRNNIMFRHSYGRPAAVKFFDLQWASYSDPVVDLGFILYMNADDNIRTTHWDHLFQVYWEGVTSIEPHLGFTFEEFHRNFAKRVVLILGDLSFFIPLMISAKNGSPSLHPRDTIPMSEEKQRAIFSSLGGKEARDVVDSIVRHMQEKRYFHAFIEAIEPK